MAERAGALIDGTGKLAGSMGTPLRWTTEQDMPFSSHDGYERR
jgi:hypothetical protein